MLWELPSGGLKWFVNRNQLVCRGQRAGQPRGSGFVADWPELDRTVGGLSFRAHHGSLGAPRQVFTVIVTESQR